MPAPLNVDRTGLRTRPSEAKCLEEPDFDVQNSPDPTKSDENHEKPKKKIRKQISKKFFEVKKSKIANRPKRRLPKFRGDRGHVRRVRGRHVATELTTDDYIRYYAMLLHSFEYLQGLLGLHTDQGVVRN